MATITLLRDTMSAANRRRSECNMTTTSGTAKVIHSGQFMISDPHRSDAELSDDEEGSSGKRRNLSHEPSKTIGKSASVSTMNRPTRRQDEFNSCVDQSLNRLFQCLSLAYKDRAMTNPKWDTFKGLKWSMKDKIRLNNIIWREYHRQFKLRKRAVVVQFSCPLVDEVHTKAEACVLEGTYWKKRYESIEQQYRQWRLFYKHRLQQMTPGEFDSDSLQIDAETARRIDEAEHAQLLEAIANRHDAAFRFATQPKCPSPPPGTRGLDDMMDFEQFLSLINQPISNPDLYQPTLFPFQPNGSAMLIDTMDTFDNFSDLLLSGSQPTAPSGASAGASSVPVASNFGASSTGAAIDADYDIFTSPMLADLGVGVDTMQPLFATTGVTAPVNNSHSVPSTSTNLHQPQTQPMSQHASWPQMRAEPNRNATVDQIQNQSPYDLYKQSIGPIQDDTVRPKMLTGNNTSPSGFSSDCNDFGRVTSGINLNAGIGGNSVTMGSNSRLAAQSVGGQLFEPTSSHVGASTERESFDSLQPLPVSLQFRETGSVPRKSNERSVSVPVHRNSSLLAALLQNKNEASQANRIAMQRAAEYPQSQTQVQAQLQSQQQIGSTGSIAHSNLVNVNVKSRGAAVVMPQQPPNQNSNSIGDRMSITGAYSAPFGLSPTGHAAPFYSPQPQPQPQLQPQFPSIPAIPFNQHPHQMLAPTSNSGISRMNDYRMPQQSAGIAAYPQPDNSSAALRGSDVTNTGFIPSIGPQNHQQHTHLGFPRPQQVGASGFAQRLQPPHQIHLQHAINTRNVSGTLQQQQRTLMADVDVGNSRTGMKTVLSDTCLRDMDTSSGGGSTQTPHRELSLDAASSVALQHQLQLNMAQLQNNFPVQNMNAMASPAVDLMNKSGQFMSAQLGQYAASTSGAVSSPNISLNTAEASFLAPSNAASNARGNVRQMHSNQLTPNGTAVRHKAPFLEHLLVTPESAAGSRNNIEQQQQQQQQQQHYSAQLSRNSMSSLDQRGAHSYGHVPVPTGVEIKPPAALLDSEDKATRDRDGVRHSLPNTPSSSSFVLPAPARKGPASHVEPPLTPGTAADQKRAIHISAEAKRRSHLRNNLQVLQQLIPAFNSTGSGSNAGGPSSPESSASHTPVKVSKAVLLQETTRYITRLRAEIRQEEEAIANEKQAIEQLNAEIDAFQRQLPVTGVEVGAGMTAARGELSVDRSVELWNAYKETRIATNGWKFYVFSLIFESFMERYTQTTRNVREHEFEKCVFGWLDQFCGIHAIRQQATSAVRFVCSKTSITAAESTPRSRGTAHLAQAQNPGVSSSAGRRDADLHSHRT